MAMTWTAWSNGSPKASGAGYGLKVPVADRDAHFDRSWATVVLELPRAGSFDPIEVNVTKPSFWTDTCHELIHSGIGRWLLERRLAPWPRGAPPRLTVMRIGPGRFRVVV